MSFNVTVVKIKITMIKSHLAHTDGVKGRQPIDGKITDIIAASGKKWTRRIYGNTVNTTRTLAECVIAETL